MRSLPSGWIGTLTKLGFSRKWNRKRLANRVNCRALRMESLECKRVLASITVDTSLDALDPNDGVTTLREAVVAAAPAGDTIRFASNLNGGTITLDRTKGQIEVISKSLTIDASMLPAGITIDADDPDRGVTDEVRGNGIRVFNITDPFGGTVVTMKGLTLTGGDVIDDGGAIRSTAALNLSQCTIKDNFAFAWGGGISLRLMSGVTTIANSIFTENGADDLLGSSQTNGGAIYAEIDPDATLKITDSKISGNVATNDGGGIYALLGPQGAGSATGALLSIERTEISDNRAGDSGGGLWANFADGAEATVKDSVITRNEAGLTLAGRLLHRNSGGGIWAFLDGAENAAKLTVAGSEISANKAGASGGGLDVTSVSIGAPAINQLSVYNSTISGNEAVESTILEDLSTGGGGVHLSSYYTENSMLDAHFENVTIVGNKADVGGGIESTAPLGSARFNVWLTNSIVWGNRRRDIEPGVPGPAENLSGSFNIADTVFNLIGSGNTTVSHTSHLLTPLRNQSGGDPASGNIFNSDPLLGPLANNGGFTRTHAPRYEPGQNPVISLVIDAGSNALARVPLSGSPGALLVTDQRGEKFARVFDVANFRGSGIDATGSAVDIGAYELQAPKVIDVIVSSTMANQTYHTPYSFATETYNGQPVAGSGNQFARFPWRSSIGSKSSSAKTCRALQPAT